MSRPSSTLRSTLQASGIRRSGGPRNGFRYRRASGAPVSIAEQERIERLRIPPAWKQVVIAATATARLQTIGLDAAGRWQYRYLERHATRRARHKFDRLAAYARALTPLRSALRRHLALAGLPRERACAVAVLLLSAAALRPGTEIYARDHDT